MPVEETDGIRGFQCQYRKQKQDECLGSGSGASFKIIVKIFIKSTN
jgi:hypothetical protein